MTRKIKTRTKKQKTRKRNKSKINKSKKNVSNKYFGGAASDGIKPTDDVLTTNPDSTIKEAIQTDPTTVNTKPGPVAESVQNLANKTDAALSDAAQNAKNIKDAASNSANEFGKAASEGANNAISSVTDGLADASQGLNEGLDNASKLADSASQSLNEGLDNVSNAVSDLGNAASVGLRKNRADFLAKIKERKSQVTDLHENVKKNLTVKGLPHDIDELKEKYETSNGDEDIRNSLELENALKLHEQVEQILENPLIENLIDSSNEQVNQILASGMKMFGNAVTTAGESIPLVGEVVVLENMFRHFLYNISDGSEAATKIEQNLDQLSNIVSDIGKVKDAAKKKDDTPPNATTAETTVPRSDDENELTNDKKPPNATTAETTVPRLDGESGEQIQTPEAEQVNQIQTPAAEPPAKQEANPVKSIEPPPAEQKAKSTGIPSHVMARIDELAKIAELKKNMEKLSLQLDVATEGHHTPSTSTATEIKKKKDDLDAATNAYETALNNSKKNNGITGGGAMSAMQRRINTSIEGFLQSSILNVW